MNNMELYEHFRSVPDWAKKPISGGRMNGKTDISPMWRIQALTEVFGPCGYGWRYEIVSQRLEPAGKEIKAFVDINLFVKWGENWSEAIPGIGGNTFMDAKGYVSDECYKMALTDAISVAAKALGVGADVYMGGEQTKYSREPENSPPPVRQQPPAPPTYFTCADCGQKLVPYPGVDGKPVSLRAHAERSTQLYGRVLCLNCMKHQNVS